MKKLREMGLVTGICLEVNVRKLGFDIVAFIGIVLEKSTDYSQVIEAMEKIPEIVEVNHITGIYCLLVKIVCRDSGHLLRVLRDQIQPINGVGFTETFILLEEGVQRSVQLDVPS
jgi:Lrp/AsnC family transcriptional regulator for asnA, asnC and gidA